MWYTSVTSGTPLSDFIGVSGERVRGRDPFFEGAPEDVPSQARGVRAEAFIAGAADQQDPAAVSESPGRQRAPPEAAATGEGLSDQRHHQQVRGGLVDTWGWVDLTFKTYSKIWREACVSSNVYGRTPPPSGQFPDPVDTSHRNQNVDRSNPRNPKNT